MGVPRRKGPGLTNTSLLKPFLRAFALAYVTTTGPRLLSLILSLHGKSFQLRTFLQNVHRILVGSLVIHGFPAFCGALVGGYTFLQLPLRIVIDYIVGSREWDARGRVKIATTRFLAAVAASWISFPLLNIAQKPEQHLARKREVVGDIIPEVGALPYVEKQSTQCQPTPLAGTTMDLTLLAASRALDAAVTNLWSRHKISRMSRGKWTDFEAALSHLADAGIFAVSAGAVMWAWFYLPDRLPRAYNEWIASAAQVDQRLVMTLRKARWGEFVYGRNTGQATLLQSMCKDYKWPTVWGDPAKTIPIPCEMVHMGTGPSCHWHAAVRFVRAFKFALAMYLPLQLLVRARSPSIRAFKQAVKDAIRSSAFLGAFIGLFYYSVCLSRTRIGPKIFSPKMITPMMWDQGLCVGAGCMMCGWSIFIEAPKRRQEVAFFVAPRAAATLFPRRYNRMYLWREQLVFSLSIGTLFTLVQENPAQIRGVLGQLLYKVLE